MEGKIIGLGGIFFKFKDPTKMNQWYKDILGMNTNDYGVLFAINQPNKQIGYLQLGTFPEDTDYFGEQSQQAMINFRVENLESFIETLKQKNVCILDEMESYEYGKFIHISDPEGNRIELWEPIDKEFSAEPTTEMY